MLAIDLDIGDIVLKNGRDVDLVPHNVSTMGGRVIFVGIEENVAC